MNTDLRKIYIYFEKDFFQLMNNAVFQKTMEHVRKHRDAELSTTEKKKEFVSIRAKLSYYKVFQRISVINKNEKNRDNKPVYLGLSVLELSKILQYEIWHDYVKPKYGEIEKFCYIDLDRFIVYIKQMLFIKISQKILRLDVILQIMN